MDNEHIRRRRRQEQQVRFLHTSLFILALGLILFVMGGCMRPMTEHEILDQILQENLRRSVVPIENFKVPVPEHFPKTEPFIQVRFV